MSTLNAGHRTGKTEAAIAFLEGKIRGFQLAQVWLEFDNESIITLLASSIKSCEDEIEKMRNPVKKGPKRESA